MKKLPLLFSSVLAGMSIGFGGLAFLSVDNRVIGAALFAIGGNLAGSRLARSERDQVRDMGLIAGIKLILHPLLAAALVCALPGLSPELRVAAITFAAMPTFALYPMFCLKYGMEQFCSAVVVISTLCSFATITVALWLARLFVMP